MLFSVTPVSWPAGHQRIVDADDGYAQSIPYPRQPCGGVAGCGSGAIGAKVDVVRLAEAEAAKMASAVAATATDRRMSVSSFRTFFDRGIGPAVGATGWGSLICLPSGP